MWISHPLKIARVDGRAPSGRRLKIQLCPQAGDLSKNSTGARTDAAAQGFWSPSAPTALRQVTPPPVSSAFGRDIRLAGLARLDVRWLVSAMHNPLAITAQPKAAASWAVPEPFVRMMKAFTRRAACIPARQTPTTAFEWSRRGQVAAGHADGAFALGGGGLECEHAGPSCGRAHKDDLLCRAPCQAPAGIC